MIDAWLDLCVFAPLGFAVSSRELVPELVAKGRQHLDVQVRVARMIGQFALSQGRSNVSSTLGRLRPATSTPTAPSPAAPSPTPPPPFADEELIPVRIEPAPVAPAVQHGDIPTAGDLAIPGYDALAASQVVTRLAGLTPEELEVVRRYEATHRGRRTILGKISQLQG